MTGPAESNDDVLVLVEAHLLTTFGEPSGRAEVTFVGTDPVEMLRFGPDEDGLVRYATVGMSRFPLQDSMSLQFEPIHGPRAEVVLSVRGLHDSLLRNLAMLAASPAVEGLTIEAGDSLDLGASLWEGAPFTAVLVGEPGGLVEDLRLDWPRDPVRFFPLIPMTKDEAAWKRAKGVAALEQQWLEHGVDVRDPERGSVLKRRS